jgi:hypothetical protein
MKLALWVAAAALLVTPGARGDGEAGQIDGIEGEVSIFRAGQTVPAADLALLQPGDQVRTGDGSARVAFPNGSLLTMAEKTQVTLESPDPAAPTAHSVSMDDGEVHVQVPHTSSTDHKFLIKTKTAIMGVRGTEFVVSQAGAESELHTLNGQVEVAGSREELAQGKGRPVRSLEALRATRAGFSPVAKFRRADFLKALHQRHPRLAHVYKRKPRRARAAKKERRHLLNRRRRRGQ